jgi:hypothetical protein
LSSVRAGIIGGFDAKELYQSSVVAGSLMLDFLIA